MFRGSAALSNASYQTQQLGSQIVPPASPTLVATSPYRTIVNSASPTTVTMPATPASNDTRVISNVGAGTVTVSYAGRAGASTKTIAQDNANTFAFNATLGYWTLE